MDGHQKMLQSLSAFADDFLTTKLIVSTVPYCYDLPHSSSINHAIKLINKHIQELTSKCENVVLIDVFLFVKGFFTNHGLRLNMKSKKHLSHLIESIINYVRLAEDVKKNSSPSIIGQCNSGKTSRSLLILGETEGLNADLHVTVEMPMLSKFSNKTNLTDWATFPFQGFEAEEAGRKLNRSDSFTGSLNQSITFECCPKIKKRKIIKNLSQEP